MQVPLQENVGIGRDSIDSDTGKEGDSRKRAATGGDSYRWQLEGKEALINGSE